MKSLPNNQPDLFSAEHLMEVYHTPIQPVTDFAKANNTLFRVHEHEHPEESQAILDDNRDIFSKDCRKVYNLLMAGHKATIKEMNVDRARISDLKRNGVQMAFKLVDGRYKRWYMTKRQKWENRELEKKILQNACTSRK